MKHTIDELKNITFRNRTRFLELFTALGYGHLTSAFSWAEIATVLYYEIMTLPVDGLPDDISDRMVISKGHGAGMLFPIFEDLGWFTKEQMENIIRPGGDSSKINKMFYPGFDFYGGSLGIGIGLAVGMAKGDKLSSSSKKTYCLVGDAECYEGSVWEAVNFAGHNKLNNLIVIVDRNNLGCSDFTEHMVKLEPFRERWESFGWEVHETNGHDLKALYDTFNVCVQSERSAPKCIIAHTKKGQGLDYVIDKPLMHGFIPKKPEDIARAFRELK